MNLNKPQAEDAAAQDAAAAINPADILAMVAEHGQPVKDAVLDLPAQVYTLARVTLAARFIYEEGREGQELKHGFNAEGFNQAWQYLTGEAPPEAEEAAE